METASIEKSPADQYVAAVLAVQNHVPAEAFDALTSEELDRRAPGARDIYLSRSTIAAQLLERLPVDPQSAEYRAAAAGAQEILQQVDDLGPDPIA